MPPRAPPDRRIQQRFELGKVSDLAADLLQMMNCDLPNLIATGLARAAELEDRANLIRSETKLPRAPDKAQRPDMLVAIYAMPALRPWGRGQQPNPLEIADRLNIDAGAARQIAYRYASHEEMP
jgi:hypothetical protein